MASLQYTEVSKHFGRVVALDRLNLSIADGAFVALLGPSGCGKTTTLRLLAGLESPTTGEISIGGRDVTALPPRDRDIAMVFQDYALYPHMSVAENIGYPLKVRRTAAATIQKRVQEVADLLQIGHLLARKPGQLSGGQQQRVSVARALVYTPQAFLFDEPLSNLDAKLRLEARSFLRNLQRKLGVTSVYVTHDQAEAMALADLIAVMDRGKLVQLAPPLEVYRRPATTFVAGFIGNPPMNLLPCRVADGMIHVTGGALPLPAVPGATRAATLGFRAERATLNSMNSTNSAESGISAVVYAVQPLGGETLVTLQVGDSLVTVRHFGDDVPDLHENAAATLYIPPAHCYLYDADGALIA